MKYHALILLFTFNQLFAAIITVDRADDLMVGNDGGCDLRDAVNSANFNSSFGDCVAGTNSTDFVIISVAGPIQLTNEIDVLTAMSISPPLGSNAIVTINAAVNERIFEIHPTSEASNDFEFKSLHLVGGKAVSSDGGAMVFYRFNDNDFGSIYIADCIFEDNRASFGGAIAIDDTFASSVSILRNTFINNQAVTGGAISSINASTGTFSLTLNQFNMNKAILGSSPTTAGAVFIVDSSPNSYKIFKNQFLENTSADNVGALDLRGFNLEQQFLLEQNVFLYNQADDYAGALSVGDLAVANIYNSTFAYNTASRGGAIVNVGGNVNLRASTVVYNSASSSGANMYFFNGNGNINRSIIAYPTTGSNCSGNLTGLSSGSLSVMDDQTCAFNNSTDFETDPKLSGLINHSTGLPGFIPALDSVAIDSIHPNVCTNHDGSPMTQDQQGNMRPIDDNNDGSIYCNSGAIEASIDTDIIFQHGFEN